MIAKLSILDILQCKFNYYFAFKTIFKINTFSFIQTQTPFISLINFFKNFPIKLVKKYKLNIQNLTYK